MGAREDETGIVSEVEGYGVFSIHVYMDVVLEDKTLEHSKERILHILLLLPILFH